MAEIVTEGAGWVDEPGEHAELEVVLTARAPTRAEAVRLLGERAPVFDLPAIARAVRRRGLMVQDDWSKGERIVGTIATENVQLIVTEHAEQDGVVAALVAAEASVTGPRWLLADPGVHVREAQRRAVADARERAEGYAAALGLTLGPLVKLTEGPGWGHDMAAQSLGASGAPDVRALRLDPEPVRVTVRCTATWQAG